MNTRLTHPKASNNTRNNSTGIMTDPMATLRRSLLSTALAATVAAVALPCQATPARIETPAVEPGSIVRLHTDSDDAAFEIDVPRAGLLTLDAVTTVPELDTEIVLLTEGEGWRTGLVTQLERSDNHLAAAIHGAVRLTLRVASQGASGAAVKVVTDFNPADVIDDAFAPEAPEASGTRVVRSRFYSSVSAAKGDAEPVDPDPGLTAGSGGGQLLASVATWRTDAATLKGDAEPVDPDPGLHSNEPESHSQVLFYQGACGAAAVAGEADDHADLIACATALFPGRPMTGEIANAVGDDGDVFSFVLDDAATVEVTTAGDSDTFGELLDRSGRILTADDDEGSERNFRLAQTLLPGRYFVRVRGVAGAEGPYELSLAIDGR